MDVKGITICQTRDRGMAVWAELSTRGWTVTVCVANAAAAIAKGSTFDVTASKRVESDLVEGRPLLPRRFSEVSCSLVEGQRRPVVAMRLRLDHDLGVQFFVVDEAVLVSQRSLSFGDVGEIYKSDEHELHPLVARLARLAEILARKRSKAGAFALVDLEAGQVSSEEGVLVDVAVSEGLGRLIVREMQILVNAELAKYCVAHEIRVPFRTQTAKAAAPDREKLIERLALGQIGRPSDLQVAKSQFAMVVNRARYSDTLEGHYALNLPVYVHGTDPLRRYADLVLQRQVLAHIAKSKQVYSATDIENVVAGVNSAVENAEYIAITRVSVRDPEVKEGTLAHLSSKDFQHLVEREVLVDNKFVRDEFVRRLKGKSSTISAMHAVLLSSSPEWAVARNEIFAHLERTPGDAMAIAAMASQASGWSSPVFRTKRVRDGDRVAHVAQVRFERPGIDSDPVQAGTLKLAKCRAVMNALAKVNLVFVGEKGVSK